jgi:hypothetical protein
MQRKCKHTVTRNDREARQTCAEAKKKSQTRKRASARQHDGPSRASKAGRDAHRDGKLLPLSHTRDDKPQTISLPLSFLSPCVAKHTHDTHSCVKQRDVLHSRAVAGELERLRHQDLGGNGGDNGDGDSS